MIDWDILVILDRSGSMQDARKDHEGGLRSFIDDQKAMGGDVRFTLVQFDTTDPCEIIYDRAPMADVGAIELIPRGGTPLLDAIGKAVAHLRSQQEREPATHTLVMVITDGEENSSTEWTVARVKSLLEDVEKAGGKTLYLGANVDAFAEAGSVGVASAYAMNYSNTPASVGQTYTITSSKVLRSRTLGNMGASVMSVNSALAYTDEERAAIANADAPVFSTTPTTTTSTQE